jgi:hypothetical protein
LFYKPELEAFRVCSAIRKPLTKRRRIRVVFLKK